MGMVFKKKEIGKVQKVYRNKIIVRQIMVKILGADFQMPKLIIKLYRD
jgi:hypothetical protein